MNRHTTTEQLSAYLDSELGFVEMRQLEAHCGACPECGTRLASMRRVVAGFGRVDRAMPPPALGQQIRRQVMTEIPAHGMRRTFQSLRFFLFPLGSRLRTAAAMGLALVVSFFAVSHGPGGLLPGEIQSPPSVTEEVTVEPGAIAKPTTSRVAGRDFIWTEVSWVQQGLEWETPVASVDSRSPEGRKLLNKYSELKLLLADGSPVVLRYNLETVEIRNAPPNRVIGFEAQPTPVSRRNVGVLAA
jgi:Putative zinc-finger